MIVNLIISKELNTIVTELFIRGRKLNTFLVFITKSHFAVPKNYRLIQHTSLLRKFQSKDNFSRLHLIIHQILNLKTL